MTIDLTYHSWTVWHSAFVVLALAGLFLAAVFLAALKCGSDADERTERDE